MATYTDIDLSFSRHPGTKDVLKKYDIEAAKAAIRNIVLSSRYDKPFDPDFGLSIKSALFELNTVALNTIIKRQLEDQIMQYDARVQLEDIQFNNKVDDHTLELSIYFYIIGFPNLQSVNISVERVR